VTFYLTISADNGASVQDSLNILIGQYPALVLDLDPNTSSGPAIVSALQANGMVAVYSTAFPSNLLQYQSVFCCLGVYSNNRVLSSSEGQMLADYLEAGGRLYMEGGDTWAYDPQTAVHPMFGITGVSDGSSDLVSVNGLSGTFASGMTFSYSGEKNWIDRLASNSPAYSTFQNSSPVYVTTIAKDGGNYRTIGASHEFGGLTNGTYTKIQLMAEYMVFLGLPVISTWQGTTNNWNTPGNWSNGIIPDNDINVVIPYNPGAPYPVQFTGGSAECKSLKVQQGVNFTLPAGVVFTIHQ
jgi:hypothetical protein